jgi:hypothetical protein
MNKNKWKAISVISILLVITIGILYCNKQNELDLVKSSLKLTESELNTSIQKLDNAKIELNNAQIELNETETTLSQTKADLEKTNLELNNTKANLEIASDDILRYIEILNGLSIYLKHTKEIELILDNPVEDLVDNPNASNPTWNELLTFLKNDKTEYNTYIADIYDCTNYAHNLHNNAERLGIKCAVVIIYFSNDYFQSHELNAFITTDYGLIYIDSTGSPDCECRIKHGKEYRAYTIDYNSKKPRENWKEENYYYIPSSTFFTYNPYTQTHGGAECITEDILIYWN